MGLDPKESIPIYEMSWKARAVGFVLGGLVGFHLSGKKHPSNLPSDEGAHAVPNKSYAAQILARMKSQYMEREGKDRYVPIC